MYVPGTPARTSAAPEWVPQLETVPKLGTID